MNWVSKHHTPHLNNHYSESLAGKWFQSISHSCWLALQFTALSLLCWISHTCSWERIPHFAKKSKDKIFFFLGGYFCLSALFCCLFVFYVFIILYYTWYHHFSAMKVNKYCVLIIFSSHLQVHFISYFSYTVIFYLSIPVCLTRLSERWPKQWWSLSSTATCRLTLLGSHSTSTEPPPSTTAWLLCTTAVFAIRWEVM